MQFMNLGGANYRPNYIQRIAGIPVSIYLRTICLVSFFLFSFFASEVNGQATISASATSACENGNLPTITFDANSPNGGPYTFSYTRNGNAQTDIQSNNPPTS